MMTKTPKDDGAFRRLADLNLLHAQLSKLAEQRLPRKTDGLLGELITRCYMASKNASLAPSDSWPKWAKVRDQLEDVRQCLAGMYYHLRRINGLEQQIAQCMVRRPVSIRRVDGHYFVGVTNMLSFEFHALSFDAVRTVTYLKSAVGTVFDVALGRTSKAIADTLAAQRMASLAPKKC